MPKKISQSPLYISAGSGRSYKDPHTRVDKHLARYKKHDIFLCKQGGRFWYEVPSLLYENVIGRKFPIIFFTRIFTIADIELKIDEKLQSLKKEPKFLPIESGEFELHSHQCPKEEAHYSANRREWEKLTTPFYADTIDYLQNLLKQERRLIKNHSRKDHLLDNYISLNIHRTRRDLLKKILKELK